MVNKFFLCEEKIFALQRFFWHYCTGFPDWVQPVGGHFGQNDQKLHENYKINVFVRSYTFDCFLKDKFLRKQSEV